MRTFGIVVGTIFAFLVVGIGGYLLGWGALWKSDAIVAEVTSNGDLEITSRTATDVVIKSVTFNDRRMVYGCTSASKPILGSVPQRVGPNYLWYQDWRNVKWYNGVSLSEGDVVVATFDRSRCGDKIVKAEVVTDLGTYVFRYPQPSRTYQGGGYPIPLTSDWWADIF
jgi:hypothetical protein